jgi:hypothetical protein
MDSVLGATISNDIWFVVKIMVIVGLSLYCVFAFVIVRQVTHMIATLEVGFETPIRIFTFLHFFAALGLLILSITIL